MTKATSPAASGPAGAHFEGQVGAMYLLTLLTGAEPRGLPGTIIDSVKFQRGTEGYPLDDVIVSAHDVSGAPATLEIQVKRDISFAPKDEVFKKVVGQIAETAGKPEFWSAHHEIGIAISRSSRKIEGPYQDVLTWARQLGDSRTFFERMQRPGSANDDMREFIRTFQSHLREAGAANDDETVWKLLRRLQIFVFDFTAVGSASEELMRERAVRALQPEDAFRAAALWNTLIEFAISIASAGGERTREALTAQLAANSYRLAGLRQNLTARLALAEASRNTLNDISDRIGGVMLTRHDRVTAVRNALDTGRYVEIRGDAGVGKSGVLKHFAEQISSESAVIALSHTRTVPKGWTAFRSQIGFDGLASELLSELAGSGGGIVFIDGLDFFGAEERLTAIDLVREAAKVPGMAVIVTARRDFGTDDPNWLPQEALDKLGRATPVVINELSNDETEELSFAAPQLTALLSESHPARQVARNLFRLSRLANRSSAAPALRTEAEMAEDWWLSADGMKDSGLRDRARVLRALAEQTLAGADRLTVDGLPSIAVESLIASETLRDLRNDRVAFRHDVLREWAVANLIDSDYTLASRLPLDRPAPAGFSRAIEITARLAIERTEDAGRWRSLHEAFNGEIVNESWNRAVLLALVRSETAVENLSKASSILVEDGARVLRTLIRVVIAVESEPSSKFFAQIGVDPQKIPADLTVPTGPAWGRLIFWLLGKGVEVPARALPEIVSLYWNWAFMMGGGDPFTPTIVRWFFYWLSEMNPSQEQNGKRRVPFNGELSSYSISSLKEDLETNFRVLCGHVPELAVMYLRRLRENPDSERAIQNVLKFRGSLAQAAPKELAQLTADYLLAKGENRRRRDYDPFSEAFGYRNYDFVPASPTQGPFYELLTSAPEHALPLIRRIVDHAAGVWSRGKHFGKNALTIAFPDGSEKVFAWNQTYGWSRDLGAGPAVVTSALMALEAWGHGRIEKGDDVGAVIADIVGESPVPAAYLLVVVDLLISHWPKSSAAAIPYAACPELLWLDRQRVIAVNMEFPDILGVRELAREPIGPVSTKDLKRRPSRQSSLDRLLDCYSFESYEHDRAILVDLLSKAKARLGPPQKRSNLGDPEFMVIHALNRVDPMNWQETTIETTQGTNVSLEYASPAAERDHLKPQQEESAERNANALMQLSIRIVLNDDSRSTPDFVAAAVKWAQSVAADGEKTAQKLQDESTVIAALIAARDGGPATISEHRGWIRRIFARALSEEHEEVHRIRTGLRYNPPAIAFAGTALLLRNQFDMHDVRMLLEAAGNNSPAAAQGLNYVATMLAEIDDRLPRALLRCAFVACVRPSRQLGTSEQHWEALAKGHREKVDFAIEAEIAWLAGSGGEPRWPAFAPYPNHSRGSLSRASERLPREPKEARQEYYTDHQAAALWLSNAEGIFDVEKRPWLRDLARAYSSWAATVNGSHLDNEDAPDRVPDDWNRAYLKLVARCLPGLTIPEIDEFALRHVLAATGRTFLNMTAVFLRFVDEVYFNCASIGEAEAVHIRNVFAARLMETRQWKWKCQDLSESMTTDLGPAIATLLFNDFDHFRPTKCYLYPKGLERLDPFIPMLKNLSANGPFLFIANTLLNLLEVSPQPSHLEVVLAACQTWFAAHPDRTEFWIGSSIGRRVCYLIEAIANQNPNLFAQGQPAREEVLFLVGKLVRLGISDAHQLEASINKVK